MMLCPAEEEGGVWGSVPQHDHVQSASLQPCIWNLATPDIDVYVDIEVYDIDVLFDIEHINVDIGMTVFDIVYTKRTSISTKRRYRSFKLQYRDLISKQFDIVPLVLRYRYRSYSISKLTLLHIGSYIEDTRYRSLTTSISKLFYLIYRSRYRSCSISNLFLRYRSSSISKV
jgi:hypothetical protein